MKKEVNVKHLGAKGKKRKQDITMKSLILAQDER